MRSITSPWILLFGLMVSTMALASPWKSNNWVGTSRWQADKDVLRKARRDDSASVSLLVDWADQLSQTIHPYAQVLGNTYGNGNGTNATTATTITKRDVDPLNNLCADLAQHLGNNVHGFGRVHNYGAQANWDSVAQDIQHEINSFQFGIGTIRAGMIRLPPGYKSNKASVGGLAAVIGNLNRAVAPLVNNVRALLDKMKDE